MNPRITFLLLALVLCVPALVASPNGDLKVLVSLEENVLTFPFPARATLHFHNAGQQPIWLYRRVSGRAEDGSSLEVRLEPVEALDPQQVSTAARGEVFGYAGLPRPRLVTIAPGDDATEKATLKLLPARVGEGEGKPIWGRYRLVVVYTAAYANAASIARETNVALWEGNAASNALEVELRPPEGDGVVTGSVLSAQGRSLFGVVVTLSGEDEHPLDQMLTEADGRFAFGPLPPGLYWVTVRRESAAENTTVFRHVTLTPEEPVGSIEFVLYPPETYEPRNMLHKPVILLVTDREGKPLDDVSYQIVWSSGKMVETERGKVDADGTATFQLIPGRSYVTLRRRRCPKQEDRMDVTPASGVDGFRLVFACSEE